MKSRAERLLRLFLWVCGLQQIAQFVLLIALLARALLHWQHISPAD